MAVPTPSPRRSHRPPPRGRREGDRLRHPVQPAERAEGGQRAPPRRSARRRRRSLDHRSRRARRRQRVRRRRRRRTGRRKGRQHHGSGRSGGSPAPLLHLVPGPCELPRCRRRSGDRGTGRSRRSGNREPLDRLPRPARDVRVLFVLRRPAGQGAGRGLPRQDRGRRRLRAGAAGLRRDAGERRPRNARPGNARERDLDRGERLPVEVGARLDQRPIDRPLRPARPGRAALAAPPDRLRGDGPRRPALPRPRADRLRGRLDPLRRLPARRARPLRRSAHWR